MPTRLGQRLRAVWDSRGSRVGGHRRIKVYAERNTGSNYLESLIERNLDAELVLGWPKASEVMYPSDARWGERIGEDALRRILARRAARFHVRAYPRVLGWKHSQPSLEGLAEHAGDVVFVTLTKNPYSWLLSLFRNPYQRIDLPEEFDDFVTMPWETQSVDNMAVSETTPVGLWNLKNATYLQMQDVFDVVSLRYEDLVVEPEACVARIARELGVAERSPAFENVQASTKTIGRDYDDYRAYYVEERWRSELTPRSVERINAALDRGVADAFGYEVIDPSELRHCSSR